MLFKTGYYNFFAHFRKKVAAAVRESLDGGVNEAGEIPAKLAGPKGPASTVPSPQEWSGTALSRSDIRVLNIMLAAGRGGFENLGLRYHEALAAEGYVVQSLGHPDGLLAQSLPSRHFRPLTSGGPNDVIAAARLYNHVRETRPHLILCHGSRAARLALMPFVAQGAQVVPVVHSPRAGRHLRRAAAAICVGGGARDGLAAAAPGLKLFDVPGFSWLRQRDVKPAPTLPPVIGAFGCLNESKGFDLLLRAGAALRDKGFDFRLRIAGDGPELQNLHALRSELGLMRHVEFPGWVSDPEAFMAGLDLFVVPSRSEAFGLAAAEAMAAGVPVVASNIRGLQDILKGGRFGRLSRSDDAVSLTGAIAAAFSDWDGSLAVARAARRHALSSFGFAPGSARLRRAIDTIVQAGKTGDRGETAFAVGAVAAE